MLSTFQPLVDTLDLRFAQNHTIGRISGMLTVLSDFSTKGVFFLAEVTENDFAVMTAGQVRPEDVVTVVVIATDLEDRTMPNALVQMSLHSEPRLSVTVHIKCF